MTTDARIRPIRPADDRPVAAIIREVMTSFGACGPGFAIHDPEVDAMSANYAAPRSAYFVLEADGRVLGGAGIAPLAGAEPDVCELRKMYFLPEVRGRGLGARLLAICLDAARGFGYRRCYLETLTGMDEAQRLYARAGFRRLCAAQGATGHFGCDQHFELELQPPPEDQPCW
ncbi:MAG: GNAT family N-acetyltransferase [Gammaproteobacteria bacterium]|nr:GNAT family N-acetyltransferase [Gammaproteobacteria bacterium]